MFGFVKQTDSKVARACPMACLCWGLIVTTEEPPMAYGAAGCWFIHVQSCLPAYQNPVMFPMVPQLDIYIGVTFVYGLTQNRKNHVHSWLQIGAWFPLCIDFTTIHTFVWICCFLCHDSGGCCWWVIFRWCSQIPGLAGTQHLRPPTTTLPPPPTLYSKPFHPLQTSHEG